MTDNEMPKAVHPGRNIKRFREMWGIKQEALAEQLGEGWTQKKISTLEAKEVIDAALLDELAKALKVTPDVIKNFTEEGVINYFNTFNDVNNGNNGPMYNYGTYNFNPLEEFLKEREKNDKLTESLMALVQKLLDK